MTSLTSASTASVPGTNRVPLFGDSNLVTMSRLLNSGTVQVSSLASRTVSFAGYPDDAISLQTIAKSLYSSISYDRRSLNEEECRAGLVCIEKMREFYRVSDEMIDNSHLIIMKICDFFLKLIGRLFYGHRTSIESRLENFFSRSPNCEAILRQRMRSIEANNRSAQPLRTPLFPPVNVPPRPRSNDMEQFYLSQLPFLVPSHNQLSPPVNPPPSLRFNDIERFYLSLLAFLVPSNNQPALTDDAIRNSFQALPNEVKDQIKHQMWRNAGGESNPQPVELQGYANGADWANAQLGLNPLPRQQLLAAVRAVVQPNPSHSGLNIADCNADEAYILVTAFRWEDQNNTHNARA